MNNQDVYCHVSSVVFFIPSLTYVTVETPTFFALVCFSVIFRRLENEICKSHDYSRISMTQVTRLKIELLGHVNIIVGVKCLRDHFSDITKPPKNKCEKLFPPVESNTCENMFFK